MFPRYYWIAVLILVVLTAAISFATRRHSLKEILLISCWIAGGIVLLVGVITGVSKLLVVVGIAERGFVL